MITIRVTRRKFRRELRRANRLYRWARCPSVRRDIGAHGAAIVQCRLDAVGSPHRLIDAWGSTAFDPYRLVVDISDPSDSSGSTGNGD